MDNRVKRLFFKKEIAVVVIAVVITTVGIRASDSLKLKDDISNNGCPIDMVYVPSSAGGFCIDIFEASAGEGCLYREELNVDKTRANLKTANCFPESIKGSSPWRYISRDQAALACAKSGKRLASANEWYQAALGTDDMDSSWTKDTCQVNNNWQNQPGLTGSGENCLSSAGAYDMIGNVWEWVDGTINDSKFQDIVLPEQGYVQAMGAGAMPASTADEINIDYNNDYFWIKNTGSRAIARGGYWSSKEEAGVYSVYAVAKPSYAGDGIGFRCAR